MAKSLLAPVVDPLVKPDSKDAFYEVMIKLWDKISVVMSGTQAMRDAGETYTPKFISEDAEEYKDRLKKTDLTNVMKDSVQNVVARPFSKALTLDAANSAPEYVEWSKNIDRQGNNINAFGKKNFGAAVTYGWAYILVDYPNTYGRKVTKADETRDLIQPYFVHIRAKEMIAYREWLIEGKMQCGYLKYESFRYEYDHTGTAVKVHTIYEISASEQYDSTAYYEDDYQLEAGFFKTHESRDGAAWSVASEGSYEFNAVTCVKVDLSEEDDTDEGVVIPPFMDLCEKNIAHWNSTSDQSNILTRTRFAMYLFKGLDVPKDDDGDVKTSLGPDTVFFGDADSGIDAVTLPTSGIEQGWVDLENKKEEMRMMGLDPLVTKSSSDTATGDAITDEKSNSALENWALTYAECLERAFMFAGAWAKLADVENIKVKINTRFGVTNTEINEIKTFQHMQSMGQLSLKTLLKECENRQMFGSDFSVDDEVDAIAEETAAAMYAYEIGGAPPTDKSKDKAKAKGKSTHKALPNEDIKKRYAPTVSGPRVG